jgi:hypothetical protein
MPETIGAEILIGGQIPGDLVPELCAAISREDISLEWGDTSFHPDTVADLLSNRTEYEDSQVLRLCDDQARLGRFEQLETFLQRHGIAFDRFSEGKWEYDPEWVAFRPGGEPVVIATDASREPTVAAGVLSESLMQIAGAIQELDQGGVQRALAAMRAVWEALSSEMPKIPASLQSLEIVAVPVPG